MHGGDDGLYPYSVLPIPAIDRAVLTTTDMDNGHKEATSQWVQFWRLSDLSLLKSVALPPGPRGDEHYFTGEPKLLPDGQSVYVHTFNCGLYLVRAVDRAEPSARFVHGFPGKDCGVPVLTSHYWLQTVVQTHPLVALDIADPEHPREVSRVTFGDDEQPHWLSKETSHPTGNTRSAMVDAHGCRRIGTRPRNAALPRTTDPNRMSQSGPPSHG
jgi:hypothetical protein